MNDKYTNESKTTETKKRIQFSKENWYRLGALIMAVLMLLGAVAGVLAFILQ